MDDTDFATFDRAFRRVCSGFRVRLGTKEREELTRIYFKLLEPYELPAVVAVGRRCLEQYKKFPSIAEWVMELDRRAVPPAAGAASATWRQMTTSEHETQEGAARARYEDLPCACAACTAAGIARPVRFVPTLIGGVEERAYNPRTQRLEVVGHWAHGDELRRWYVARDAFFARAPRRMRRVVELAFEPVGVVIDREPGEDG
jgi:hypothetical protein